MRIQSELLFKRVRKIYFYNNTMKCSKRCWIITLIVVIVVALAVILAVWFWPKAEENKLSIAEKLAVLTDADKQVMAHYTNGTLKIAFGYPKFWGPIVEHQKGGQIVLVFEGVTKEIVLVASDPDAAVGDRGGYFGDVGYGISSEASIKNYCGKEWVEGECKSFENKRDVLMVKNTFTTATEGGYESDMPTDQYYFYNPNTKYRGFVISPVRIATDKINDFDKQFENLIQSIEIIK